MSTFTDDNLLQEFVAESRDHLSTIEPDLLMMEQQGENTDSEVVNRIFRAIHSIKGASGFFGFEGLKNLSHVMENLLMLIRDGQLLSSPQLVEALLQGVDKLNALLADIHASDSVSIEMEVASLSALLEHKHEATHKEAAKPAKPASKKPLSGSYTYCLTVDISRDLREENRTLSDFIAHLNTVGQVISREPDTEQDAEAVGCCRIIFSTVLEPDLVLLATSLPESQIVSYTESENATQIAESTPVPRVQAGSNRSNTKSAARNSSHDATDSIRVRIDLLNKLMELAGELVLSRNQLLRTLSPEAQQISGLPAIAQNIDLITSDLQEHIMQTRMQPIGSVFGKFPRIIRDMAKQLGKDINLMMEGEDVELDKSIIESLSDPLTHLIRNCCDHGIELPEERTRQGKFQTGTILLRAFHQDGQINISITDDGRGIDTDKLASKAIQKGLITEAEVKAMSSQELTNLIFLPGLSTAEKVSDISGRGVGMDVVKTNINRLGGQIQIETTCGEGTSLLLRLPLTLAIIPSLIVGIAGQRFAIPQINLVELVHIRAEDIPSRIEKVGSAAVLRLRGQLLPLLRLADVLEIRQPLFIDAAKTPIPDRRQEIADIRPEQATENRRQSGYNIIVLRAGNHQFGLIVDELFDTEEIVVKSLSNFLKNCRCFSGATIMGDGRVAMILDPNGIIAHTGLSFENIESERQKLDMAAKQKDAIADGQTLLFFNNAPQETFAVPLTDVLRLEKFNPSEITRVGNREFINYEGRGLPLMRLEDYLPVGAFPDEHSEAYLIIPKQGNGQIGIIVSRILDTMDCSAEWEQKEEQNTGISGWAVINNRITVRLEFRELLGQAGFSTQAKRGEAA